MNNIRKLKIKVKYREETQIQSSNKEKNKKKNKKNKINRSNLLKLRNFLIYFFVKLKGKILKE